MLKKVRDNFFLIIRIALAASALINIAIVQIGLSGGGGHKPDVISQFSKNAEAAFVSLVALILTFGSDIIEKGQNIDIPDILEIIIVVFIYAGTFLSVQFNLYYAFFWWDDLLHTLSGVIVGFIGFIVVYKINYKYSMNISPLLVALFSFTFAVTLGVMWEIMEFAADALTGTAHQKWDLPETEMLLRNARQGSGLRDTMSDLIVDSVGAFITSIITYRMYKHKKKKTLAEMRKMIVKKPKS